MTDSQVLDIATDAILMATKLAGPMLLTALTVGVAVSLLQTVTQIQEMTLSFVPKAVGLVLVLVFAGHWMVRELVTYSERLWASIPTLVGG